MPKKEKENFKMGLATVAQRDRNKVRVKFLIYLEHNMSKHLRNFHFLNAASSLIISYDES